MAVNPLGAVQVHDFGLPRIVTGVARETISGGQFVTASGASGVVSSGASSFGDGDVTFYLNGSGTTVNGIALRTVTSGQLLPVAVDGAFLVAARENITAGIAVGAAGDDSVATAGAAGHVVGRPFTTAGSNTYAVVDFKF